MDREQRIHLATALVAGFAFAGIGAIVVPLYAASQMNPPSDVESIGRWMTEWTSFASTINAVALGFIVSSLVCWAYAGLLGLKYFVGPKSSDAH